MKDQSYLSWLVQETPTRWWHDSGDQDELAQAMANGASGVTTNPYLTNQAIRSQPDFWRPLIGNLDSGMKPEQRAEKLIGTIATTCAAKLVPDFTNSNRSQGYVCAQVNPAIAGDRERMLGMARRFHTLASNVAVKLPATAAGIDVTEECIAEGITAAVTVSFTIPQVVAIAESCKKGTIRARQAGITPGHCFAVIMIGRLDDYLRDVAMDRKASVYESDIRQAGLAVTKRAYSIYKEREYETVLLVAALRGTYHMTGLAGADLTMSIHPRYQAMLEEPGVLRQPGIDEPVPDDVIGRLSTIPDFVRAYEPDGMEPVDFITYGVTQKTLSQFEAAWIGLETYKNS